MSNSTQNQYTSSVVGLASYMPAGWALDTFLFTKPIEPNYRHVQCATFLTVNSLLRLVN